MAGHGCPRRFTEKQEQEIIREYTTPLPDGSWLGATTIARKWECSQPTVYNIIKRCGVPTRDATESHAHGKRCKPIVNVAPDGMPAPMCRCGCDTPVAWNRRKNRWDRYAAGHYRQETMYKDQGWLYGQYVTMNRTAREIAEQCGVTVSAIMKSMRKLCVPARDRSAARVGRHAGSRNPAWAGGVTPERQRLYKTPEWKRLVKAVYLRDGYRCQRCQRPKVNGVRFHAHHVKRWATHPELRFIESNLITLCSECHTWVHSKANTERQYRQ